MVEGRSVVAGAVTVVAAIFGITRAAQRNDAGEIMSAGSVDAFEVRIGDCFDDGAFESTQISEVPGVPCSEPHDNEVYVTFDLTETEWPGDDRIDELASEGCYDRFDAVIGKAYAESVIDYTSIYPSEGSWKQRDDREVVCVAYHMDFEKLTGSVIGSGL